MITSGEGEQAAANYKAGSVGALIAYISPAAASPSFVTQHSGSVKAPRLTADNDDDGSGVGFWRWRSMVMQICAWGSAIVLLAMIGTAYGTIALWVFR